MWHNSGSFREIVSVGATPRLHMPALGLCWASISPSNMAKWSERNDSHPPIPPPGALQPIPGFGLCRGLKAHSMAACTAVSVDMPQLQFCYPQRRPQIFSHGVVQKGLTLFSSRVGLAEPLFTWFSYPVQTQL